MRAAMPPAEERIQPRQAWGPRWVGERGRPRSVIKLGMGHRITITIQTARRRNLRGEGGQLLCTKGCSSLISSCRKEETVTRTIWNPNCMMGRGGDEWD